MISRTAMCPCCGNSDNNLLGRLPDSNWFAGQKLRRPIKGGELYRCNTCRLKFRFPAEPAATYEELYDNSTTTTWPSTIRRDDWDLIINFIRTHRPKGGKILDFGCYSGGLLSRLDASYERFGIEVNRDAAHVAQEANASRVWSTVMDIPTDMRFDIISLSDVIEHVHNPRELLEQLATILTEDGLIVVTTGDADNSIWNRFGANWWYCFYPEHIAFVSREWVEKAMLPFGWFIVGYQRFRYRPLGAIDRIIEFISACAYGYFPRAYLHLGNAFRSAIGRGEIVSIPGNGVTSDHILIAITKKGA